MGFKPLPNTLSVRRYPTELFQTLLPTLVNQIFVSKTEEIKLYPKYASIYSWTFSKRTFVTPIAIIIIVLKNSDFLSFFLSLSLSVSLSFSLSISLFLALSLSIYLSIYLSLHLLLLLLNLCIYHKHVYYQEYPNCNHNVLIIRFYISMESLFLLLTNLIKAHLKLRPL